MEYILVQGLCRLKAQTSLLAKFIDPLSKSLNKPAFSRHVFERNYEGYHDPNVGRFISLESIEPISITSTSVTLDHVDLAVQFRAYFFLVKEKAIIDVLVSSVGPKGLTAQVMGYVVDVADTDLLPGIKPDYNPATSALVFPNQKTISAGDVVRVRVTGIRRSLGDKISDNYRLKGSCIYPGCGKRE